MTEQATTVTSTSTPTESVQPVSADTTGEGQATPEQVVEEMIKLKVMGEEKEYPRSEVLKFAQQGLGANRKFEEVAKARKELENIAKNLMENPRDFLRNHPNREAIIQASQELLSEYVEEQERLSQMSESERKALELQKELDRRQKELDERDSRIKKQLQDHYRNQFQNEIVSALKDTELPVNEDSVIRVASLYKLALNSGMKTTFADCAKAVERHVLNYVDEINKKRSRVQQKQKPRIVSQSPKKESKKISMAEFHKKYEALAENR